MIKHAAIVPLIGGLPLGQTRSFGTKPDYLLSYSPFSNNDSHLVNYWKDVPYLLLDKGDVHPHYVDVVGATCPCAGLSSLSTTANSDSSANDWMITTAKYVLEEMKPKVFWGENAPRFASKMGRPIVEKLMDIARKSGYTMSIYRTRSQLHGLSQVRERSFYFFWLGDKVPLFNYFDRPHKKIEDTIRSANKNSTLQELTNKNIPSKSDPYYRYILEVIEGGISHQDFVKKISKSVDVMDYIESHGISYRDIKQFMLKEGFDIAASKLDSIQDKLDSGLNVMRRHSYIGKDYIGAFVGHFPTSLTHPDEDRYLTVREAMTIMGLPDDFELLQPKKNLNHICQNVPVGTATDMANEIKAVLSGERDWVSAELMYQYNTNQTYEVAGQKFKGPIVGGFKDV